uniref:hypothetical protein n=1 Tax=Butyrivibrio sp. WCD2001 TaxID=1280681 RepID=UPI0005D2617D
IWIDTKITSESGNYAHGYTFIRNLLYNEGAKLQIVDGVLSVVPNIDYANTDDFIVDTDQFKAKRQYNSLTRMHCMGQGDLRDRYTIDLYLDNNGGLLPYCRDNPVKDSDYYSDLEKLSQSTNPEDISNYNLIKDNVVPGINEISEIYDYPNAQTTYHYVLLTSKPADWDTDLNPELPISDQNKRYGFQNYFYQEYSEEKEATSYKQYERPNLDTRYDLQFSMPGDWLSNFANYYEQKANGYVKVSAVSAYDVVNTMPTGWYEGAYSNYYQLIGSSYQRVSLVSGQILTTSEPENWSTNWKQYTLANGDHVPSIVPQPYYKKLATKPADWNSNYGNYYGQDGIGNYTHIAGVSKTKYKKQTKKPTDWATNYKRYYKKANNKYVAVQATSDKKAPKWEKGKYYTSYTVTSAPEFVPNLTYQLVQDPEHAPVWAPGTYYTSGKVVPTWGTITVYKKRTVPTWQTNKYYTAVTYQPLPQWISNCAYTQYEDHYQALIEGALKKIEDYRKQDTLDVKLDEKQSYDINDIIGASDEVTGISVRERIVQKIIKIQRGVVSFEYRSGK